MVDPEGCVGVAQGRRAFLTDHPARAKHGGGRCSGTQGNKLVSRETINITRQSLSRVVDGETEAEESGSWTSRNSPGFRDRSASIPE